MTFQPNLAVKEVLDLLARRLDPIIAAKLSDQLSGQAWTKVLEILDEKKGHTPGLYQTSDLSAQLRMLTERLGTWGYPFDDRRRTVSTLGSELRIVRNESAHNHDFDVVGAWRATDFAVRLLEYFGDQSGMTVAMTIRHRALIAMAAAEGVSEQEATNPATLTAPAAPDNSEHEVENVRPDPEVLIGEDSALGNERLAFEPWQVVQVGTVEVLDRIATKEAKGIVRAVAVEIATFEGPVHIDRLTALVARSFGLRRVAADRAKKIAYQVRQTELHVDGDKFVWPSSIDPEHWLEFRPNDSTVARRFEHISPREIANAARFIKSRQPRLLEEDLDRSVLQTFGRKRRMQPVMRHLAHAKSLLA